VVGVKGLVPHNDVNWDVSLSADWQWNYLKGNLANFVFPERNTVLAAAATQLYWKYLKAQASVLGTFVFDKIHQPTIATPTAYKQKPQFTPAVFLSYQPILREELFFRAYYKRIFRMPTFNDLYYTDVGNISLLPEYTTQYDGGVQYDKRWQEGACRAVSVKADGYFNQVRNKIVAIPKGNGQYRWQMMNLGYVEIRGCDVNASATFDLTHEVLFTVCAAYTYQKAQDFSDPGELTYGGQIAYIPWHSGSATVNLMWKGLSFNYAFIYVGERYHNSANIPANHEQPWYTHDASISYDMPINRKSDHSPRLHFAIEINNMLNQQYDVILNYPMPGINGKGIVRLTI
jgi:outer membrane receptor protein involved in Fe transport